MALLYQNSEINQFILSDLDRGLLPVRVITDVSTPGTFRLTLNYFEEVWGVNFTDAGDSSIPTIINGISLVDLFDLFMVQNDIPDFRESDLMSCLSLVKDYYLILIKGLDVSGWRRIDRFKPRENGLHCLGQFEENEIIDAMLVEWRDNGWFVDDQPAGLGSFTHWYDDISGTFYCESLDEQ